jgi:hypothetical protein
MRDVPLVERVFKVFFGLVRPLLPDDAGLGERDGTLVLDRGGVTILQVNLLNMLVTARTVQDVTDQLRGTLDQLQRHVRRGGPTGWPGHACDPAEL